MFLDFVDEKANTIQHTDDNGEQLSQQSVSTNGKVDFIHRQPRSLSLAKKSIQESNHIKRNR